MLKDDLINKYGPTMRVRDLAEIFHVTKGSIYNRISQNKFEIDTFKVGGVVMADTTDVADYIQQAKLSTRIQHES